MPVLKLFEFLVASICLFMIEVCLCVRACVCVCVHACGCNCVPGKLIKGVSKEGLSLALLPHLSSHTCPTSPLVAQSLDGTSSVFFCQVSAIA